MPSGFTAIIENKENVSLKEFTLRCARGMGILIEQRDDDLNVLPRLTKIDKYYYNAVDSAREELDRVVSLGKDAFLKEHLEKTELTNKEIQKSNEKSEKLKAKYEKLLSEVTNWIPPTDEHEGLKNFMISQLTESMKWDCHVREIYPTSIETDNNIYDREIKYLSEKYDKAKKYLETEKEKVEIRNNWIKQLYDCFE